MNRVPDAAIAGREVPLRAGVVGPGGALRRAVTRPCAVLIVPRLPAARP